jgi:Domain of unknown function (DUF4263)
MFDEAIRTRYEETLLGRIHLKIFQEITGQQFQIPSPASQRHYVLERHRQNHVVGSLLVTLLGWPDSNAATHSELSSPVNLTELLLSLETSPLERPLFLELTDCPACSTSPSLGALIDWAHLADGGLVYTVILIEEGRFPESLAGYVEVRASQVVPEPAISVLRGGKHEHIERSEYAHDSTADMVIQVLDFAHRNRVRSLLPFAEINRTKLLERPDLKPPIDPLFRTNIQPVIQGRAYCTLAEVSLSIVEPHDLAFCLSYPLDVVRDTADKIVNGIENALLVYWRDGVLIASDSYPFYLGYRKLGRKTVKVVIMGPFPQGAVIPIQVGGPELIPPILVEKEPDYRGLPADLKVYLLERRLNEAPLSDAVLSLYGLYFELSDMIQDPRTKEIDLHRLILKKPVALDAYGVRVHTEVRLGEDFRADLILQYELADKRVTLVELESSSHVVFTKKGRTRAEVTHALQQVEDWLRWWRENPNKIPHPFDPSVPVEGLVVIGRSVQMDDDSRRRLLNLNHNRLVKVITYDDLLERVKNLIANVESSE